MKEFDEKFFNCFDFLIVDECHTVSSEIFQQCFPKIICPYRLGLSATPSRADGLFHVVNHYIGKIVYQSIDPINSELPVIVNVVKYIPQDPKYNKEIESDNGNLNTSKMLTLLANDPIRTQHLLMYIKVLCKADKGKREILVLSDRKPLLNKLKEQLTKFDIECGLHTGGMTSEELEESKTKKVILGTYQVCGTGFNLPKLNTVIFATPRKNVEQMVGRILRQPHKINPLVLDYFDDRSLYKWMGSSRIKYYDNTKMLIKVVTRIEGNEVPDLTTSLK
jgi:superfamily II DNA or RNA helicase